MKFKTPSLSSSPSFSTLSITSPSLSTNSGLTKASSPSSSYSTPSAPSFTTSSPSIAAPTPSAPTFTPQPQPSAGGPPIKTPPSQSLAFKDPEPPKHDSGYSSGPSFRPNERAHSSGYSSGTSSSYEEPMYGYEEPMRMMPKLDVAVGAGSAPGGGPGGGPGGSGDTCGRCKGSGELDAGKPNWPAGQQIEDRQAVHFFEKKEKSTLKSVGSFGDEQPSSSSKQVCKNCKGSGKNHGF